MPIPCSASAPLHNTVGQDGKIKARGLKPPRLGGDFNMKRIVPLVAGLCLLASLFATPVLAQPPLPHAFYGTVEINGNPAPEGTEVEVRSEGEEVKTGVEGNPITVKADEAGKYGGPDAFDPKLLAKGFIEDGTILTFYVDDIEAETDPATVEWLSGWVSEVNLSAEITVRRGGGGGGGAPRDTTPPQISNILLCPEGVTETTADICWITDERSTSQVEYWTSPSMLSPLDETMVTEHHVELTGLTPCTTYNYRTMSVDEADNLAVSDVCTCTTLGEAAATAFASSDLSISPGECYCGEAVTICALVTNTSSCPGSCTVTLEINGAIEATEDVTLSAGASEEVTFTTSKDAADIYSVAVNGLSGSFTVKEELAPPTAPPEEAPPEVKPPLNWTLIGGIIAGVIIVGLLIFFVVRRRAA